MHETSDWHHIAVLSDLRENEPFAATLGDDPIALHKVDGVVYAIGDICTHEFARLSAGFVEDGVIECPLHQATFDIRTGRCVSPPASADLPVYEVRIDGDAVYVRAKARGS
jgi:3-phenylpropionate/trans-cinnamate dioxygenase ferredoxin component